MSLPPKTPSVKLQPPPLFTDEMVGPRKETELSVSLSASELLDHLTPT